MDKLKPMLVKDLRSLKFPCYVLVKTHEGQLTERLALGLRLFHHCSPPQIVSVVVHSPEDINDDMTFVDKVDRKNIIRSREL